MKKVLMNIGGLVLFYSVIIIGVLLLNIRFSYLNHVGSNGLGDTYIAMNN